MLGVLAYFYPFLTCFLIRQIHHNGKFESQHAHSLSTAVPESDPDSEPLTRDCRSWSVPWRLAARLKAWLVLTDLSYTSARRETHATQEIAYIPHLLLSDHLEAHIARQ